LGKKILSELLANGIKLIKVLIAREHSCWQESGNFLEGKGKFSYSDHIQQGQHYTQMTNIFRKQGSIYNNFEKGNKGGFSYCVGKRMHLIHSMGGEKLLLFVLLSFSISLFVFEIGKSYYYLGWHFCL